MARLTSGALVAGVVCAALACAASIEAVPDEQRRERPTRVRPQRDVGDRARLSRPSGGSDSLGLTPLTELGEGTYKGESGGLYGGGRNEPPPELAALAEVELARIVPRNRSGRPSSGGKVALLSVGMSNTHAEFLAFMDLAKTRKDLSPDLVLVDGAQGANDAVHWSDPDRINPRTNKGLWERAGEKVRAAGVTNQQVQAAWINLVIAWPSRWGDFPEHARALEEKMVGVLHLLKRDYPNVAIAFLSSRIYAGYSEAGLSPDPQAYEVAFAVRWLIERQQSGAPELNWSAERGPVRAPLLLWGPYLWADGMTPRADGLVWTREDFNRDGVHPTPAGEDKVARLLMNFFTTNRFARPWFVRSP